MYTKAVMTANPVTPCQVIFIDEDLCVGCNQCVEVCRSDVMVPNLEKGKSPVVLYPEECWFCGCCMSHCKTDALRVEYPLQQKVGWKRKETGEHFRIGMNNPPPPNTNPPVGYEKKS